MLQCDMKPMPCCRATQNDKIYAGIANLYGGDVMLHGMVCVTCAREILFALTV
ncbi:MAG: hypothetical protein JWN23_2918 [Rhodocyclales bacterium]|nr:hypothetical protein [Rhodocyclales bacterium]